MKRNLFVRLAAVVLVLVIAVSVAVPTEVFAAGSVEKTGIGDSGVFWEFDGATGKLTVSGTGAIPDQKDPNNLPWKSVHEAIKEVVVSEGVTGVGKNAFAWCLSLTKVTLPKTLTSIGDYAFNNCQKLGEITIPDRVETIGIQAFNFTMLSKIALPKAVTSIGFSVFSNCAELAGITVAEGNPVYHVSGNCLIETAAKKLIAGCKTSVIPTDGSVEIIGKNAFFGIGIVSGVIPEGVKVIEDSAFSRSGPSEFVLPESLESVGDLAFWGFANLKKVTFKSKTTEIFDFEDTISPSFIVICAPKGSTAEAYAEAYGHPFEEYTGKKTAPGDVNGDSNIDAFDYQMVKAYVLGTYKEAPAEQVEAMDVNGDTVVDAFDYQMIKAHVLGTYVIG